MMLVPLVFALAGAADVTTPYVLSIAVNSPDTSDLSPLRYADDDGAEAALLFGATPGRTFLHTVMDAESQARYPALAAQARPPTWSALDETLTTLRKVIAQDVAEGRQPVVFAWLSGHATHDADGHAYYPLAGGGRMTPADLSRRVLAPLEAAHRVHLIVDTCFAGALVASRARVHPVAPRDQELMARAAPQQSNVGVVVAATPGTRTFEWEEIRAGVFSALVRAGLRGGADVDGDGAVRYSELDAFLAAAAEGISVEAARPRVRTEAPVIERDAVLARLEWLPNAVPLAPDLAGKGAVYVLDDAGGWLLAGNFEPGFQPSLWLPGDRTLYLRTGGVDHPLIQRGGRLEMGPAAEVGVHARSLEGDALKRGLFSVPYGPAFHRGYSVAARKAAPPERTDVAPSTTSARRGAPWLVIGLALPMTGFVFASMVGGAASALSWVAFSQTREQVPALQAFAAAAVFTGLTAGALLISSALVMATAVAAAADIRARL